MTTEVLIRVSAFLGVLSLMASWEVLDLRRRLTMSKMRRWGQAVFTGRRSSIRWRTWPASYNKPGSTRFGSVRPC